MNWKRTLRFIAFVAGLGVACAPGFAQSPNFITMLKGLANTASPSLQAARHAALLSRSGTQVLLNSEDNTGWESKHKLYVGCTNTPPAKTYATIADAFAAVVPYTTIKVCAGQYAGNNSLNVDHVEVEGQGGQGAVTISCGSTQNPLDGSGGIFLNGSHQIVEKVSVINCEGGVVINYAAFSSTSTVKDDEVLDSFFTGDLIGVIGIYCDKCEVETNEFDTNTASIGIGVDTDSRIVGNEIVGDGVTQDQNFVGILMVYSIDADITSNRESGNWAGLGLILTENESVEGNSFNGNYVGVGLIIDNSANTFRKNVADGNYYDGFYADSSSGVNAFSGALPNWYVKNKAFGNGNYDYEDDTAPYTGSAHGTNSGTADFYADNKGNTASPSAIFNQ